MNNRKRFPLSAVAVLGAMVIFSLGSQDARAGTVFGVDVGDYIILYEGAGGKNLNINNFGTTQVWNGDIGIAGTGKLSLDGGNGSQLNGDINFSAPDTGQANINKSTLINGTVNYNVGDVQTKMNNLNALSTALGAENGADIAIDTKSGQTVLATSGTLIGGDRVFDITSFKSGNGENLIVKGDGSTDVLFNINDDTQFHGNILLQDLTGKFFGEVGYAGLSPDQVLFNMYAGAALTGGDTLDANNNGNAANPANIIYGTFLNPNGKISFVNTRITGRIFGGDSQDMQIVSGNTITLPNCCQAPEPPTTALFLLGAALLASSQVVRRRPRSRIAAA